MHTLNLSDAEIRDIQTAAGKVALEQFRTELARLDQLHQLRQISLPRNNASQQVIADFWDKFWDNRSFDGALAKLTAIDASKISFERIFFDLSPKDCDQPKLILQDAMNWFKGKNVIPLDFRWAARLAMFDYASLAEMIPDWRKMGTQYYFFPGQVYCLPKTGEPAIAYLTCYPAQQVWNEDTRTMSSLRSMVSYDDIPIKHFIDKGSWLIACYHP